MFKIILEPLNQVVEAENGKTLLEVLREKGIDLESTCGGRGTCGKCRVRLLEGKRQPYTAAEEKHLSAAEKNRGVVLACQYIIESDIKIYVPVLKPELSRKTKTRIKQLELEGEIQKEYIELPKPSIKDNRSDEKRLLETLQQKTGKIFSLPLPILDFLPSLLRQHDFKITAILDEEKVINIEGGNTTTEKYGIAFDIGTTTVAGNLIDLKEGGIIAATSATNRQNVYGADVISRIQYTIDEIDGLQKLQEKVIDVANEITEELALRSGISSSNIYQVTVVGNTTMSHLFLGLDPKNLAPAPFVPVFQSLLHIPAKELGLEVNSLAEVLVLPNIAGYVGSDTVGVMLATNIDELSGNTLALDIGTNGEIVLAKNGELWTCSTAAGPAFEGAEITCGMRAAEGAIEKVSIEKDDLKVVVIGETKPVGICGSGLIDAVATFLEIGVINRQGRIMPPSDLEGKVSPKIISRLRQGQIGWEILLNDAQKDQNEVVLTQKDVRELQLAKGAMRAGIEVLLREAGLSATELTQVFLAGAFGTYIDKKSTQMIGLLPKEVDIAKVKSIGNAAGDGSILALTSLKKRKKAEKLAQKVKHIELSGHKYFSELFMEAILF